MAIHCKSKIISKTQDEFHAIDKIVTGYAFNTHNEYGRFCDEKIYSEIISDKCKKILLSAEKEVEIRITLRDFVKNIG